MAKMTVTTFPEGYVINLFNKLVLEFQRKSLTKNPKGDVNIYAPVILKQALVYDLEKLYPLSVAMNILHGDDERKYLKFRGYQILPGYENKLVIAHERSLEYGSNTNLNPFYLEQTITLNIQEVELIDTTK
ncbi:MAG: hypothetical protein HOP30_11120 [Cyclobacteriaceae bacterium]|nr:hypothetical protein [Cyclobacteriaceae bacterium]